MYLLHASIFYCGKTREENNLSKLPIISIANELDTLVDTQSSVDSRGVPLLSVGVSNLAYPINILSQPTIAIISVGTSLHATHRGTHMSRLVEVVDEISLTDLRVDDIPEILHTIKSRLNAESSEIHMRFPYFVRHLAPVTSRLGMVEHQCSIDGILSNGTEVSYGIETTTTSLSPCSKDVSKYGGHNQRCLIRVNIQTNEVIKFDELIATAISVASAPVYSILKREDEKFVTEQAYDNPMFVEDIVRDLTVLMRQDKRIDWFEVNATSKESIHNHDAFASTQESKR